MDNNSSRGDYLNLFTAENILGGSPFLEHVLRLRDTLSRSSDGNIIDYDEAVNRLKDEVEDLPKLELQQDIPAGTEAVYQRQLLHALEKINDDHDRVARKLIKIKSRLNNAVTLMKNQRSQFAAYFVMAFPIAIHTAAIPNMKITAKAIEAIAAGEYSRVMDNLDNAALSTISEIELLELDIKARKANASAQYALGKDQVNLIWNSFQSNSAIGMDDDPAALLKKFPVEEEDEEVPSFISRHSKEIRVGASIKRPEPITEIAVTNSGPDPTLKVPDEIVEEIIKPFVDASVKGTFVKTGDPQPTTPIHDEDGGDLVVIRKPLLITMPQWSEEKLREIAKAEDEAGGVLIGRPEPMPDPEPVEVKEYRPKFNLTEVTDSLLNPTKKVEIEDIADYEPAKPRVIGTIVEDIESVLNEPEPLATVAPTTPRKKINLEEEGDALLERMQQPGHSDTIQAVLFGTPRKRLMLLDEDEI